MATVSTVNPVVSTAAPKERKPTYAELLAEKERLEKELAAKPAAGEQRISVRLNALGTSKMDSTTKQQVPCKGNVSVYGLGRFPVTLYASQWEALLSPEVSKVILDTCKLPGVARK